MTMSNQLKFTVGYSKTLNIGNYESEKFTLSKEFYVGSVSVDDALIAIKDAVERMMYGGDGVNAPQFK